MDGFDLNSSEKTDASELQRMNAIEQQKAQFQAEVHNFRCLLGQVHAGEPEFKNVSTDRDFVSCVDRFIHYRVYNQPVHVDGAEGFPLMGAGQ